MRVEVFLRSRQDGANSEDCRPRNMSCRQRRSIHTQMPCDATPRFVTSVTLQAKQEEEGIVISITPLGDDHPRLAIGNLRCCRRGRHGKQSPKLVEPFKIRAGIRQRWRLSAQPDVSMASALYFRRITDLPEIFRPNTPALVPGLLADEVCSSRLPL